MMLQEDLDRLICPKCNQHNSPNIEPLIRSEPHGIARCGVCGCVGLESAFKPWIWTPPYRVNQPRK